MQFDRGCLHVCMLGDAGIGQSSFLRCYGLQAKQVGMSDSSEASAARFRENRFVFFSSKFSFLA